MERSQVNYDASPAEQRPVSTNTSAWSDRESASALPTFPAQVADILGEDADPDPLFLVETWTFGIDTATHNYQARHNTTRSHLAEESGLGPDSLRPAAFRPFDFFVPLTFVEAQPSDQTGSRSIPVDFPRAWKTAYGVTASPRGDVPHHDASFNPLAPGEQLTTELACRMLGVSHSSTRKQIKGAYRQLVLRYHPDRLEHSSERDQRIATDRMTAINSAYHLLCNTAPASI